MSNKLTEKHKADGEVLTLDRAETGKRYIIKECRLPPDIKTRLAEMGLVPRAEVTVIKKAPLGDPLEIRVKGYSLCIRSTEAERFVIGETEND